MQKQASIKQEQPFVKNHSIMRDDSIFGGPGPITRQQSINQMLSQNQPPQDNNDVLQPSRMQISTNQLPTNTSIFFRQANSLYREPNDLNIMGHGSGSLNTLMMGSGYTPGFTLESPMIHPSHLHTASPAPPMQMNLLRRQSSYNQ